MSQKFKPIAVCKLANIEIADKDYTEGEKEYFTFEEALNIEKNRSDGWRLPTRREWILICEEFACEEDGDLIPRYLSDRLGLHEKGYMIKEANSIYYAGQSGHYWSSTPFSNCRYAYRLYFNGSSAYPSLDFRYFGCSVRLVRDIKDNKGE